MHDLNMIKTRSYQQLDKQLKRQQNEMINRFSEKPIEPDYELLGLEDLCLNDTSPVLAYEMALDLITDIQGVGDLFA